MSINKFSAETFTAFMYRVEYLIKELLTQNNISCHHIDLRTPTESGHVNHYYVINIVTYFGNSVKEIIRLLDEEFEMKPVQSNTETTDHSHVEYVAGLNVIRQELPEYVNFSNAKFKIIISTLLKDTKDGLEKALGVNDSSFPEELKRVYQRVSLLLEMADTELLKVTTGLNYDMYQSQPLEKSKDYKTIQGTVSPVVPVKTAVEVEKKEKYTESTNELHTELRQKNNVRTTSITSEKKPEPVKDALEGLHEIKELHKPDAAIYTIPKIEDPAEKLVEPELMSVSEVNIAKENQTILESEEAQKVETKPFTAESAPIRTMQLNGTNETARKKETQDKAAAIMATISVNGNNIVYSPNTNDKKANSISETAPVGTNKTKEAEPVKQEPKYNTINYVKEPKVNTIASNNGKATPTEEVNIPKEKITPIVPENEKSKLEQVAKDQIIAPVKTPAISDTTLITEASLVEYVTDNNIIKEIDMQIAARTGAKLNNDIDVDGDVERLRFLKITTLNQLNTLLVERKNEIISFAEKWIGADNGGTFDSGICLFYLEYLLVGKRNDPAFSIEYVLTFISDNDYSARFIIPTYNSAVN